jgi:bifunctional non-homologous end joining protein LigD
VFLYIFDLIELDGEDLRREPLDRRRAKLEKLLRKNETIVFIEHLEGAGYVIFAYARKLGPEGIVSKGRDAPYQSGQSKRLSANCCIRPPASLRAMRSMG